jgi:hypothetical protein
MPVFSRSGSLIPDLFSVFHQPANAPRQAALGDLYRCLKLLSSYFWLSGRATHRAFLA